MIAEPEHSANQVDPIRAAAVDSDPKVDLALVEPTSMPAAGYPGTKPHIHTVRVD